jgi:transposase
MQEFQQDNARPHVARICMAYLNQENINTMDWPSKSPDLSPIENLWDELGRRVNQRPHPPQNVVQLQQALLHEWQHIPQARIQHLFHSMRRRCNALVAARGGHIGY